MNIGYGLTICMSTIYLYWISISKWMAYSGRQFFQFGVGRYSETEEGFNDASCNGIAFEASIVIQV